jgi:hypothetical protein
VERSFSLESTLATAGNFFDQAVNVPGPGVSLPVAGFSGAPAVIKSIILANNKIKKGCIN